VSSTARRWFERVLVALASLAVVLALVVGYVERAAVNSDQFANRAAAALREPSVRTLIARRITDEVVLKRESNLLAARPIIQSVVSQAVGGPAFNSLFRSGIRDVHRALFTDDHQTLTLTVADVGSVLAAGLDVVRPSLATEVRSIGRLELIQRHVGAVTARAARVADVVRVLAWILLGVALALIAASLAISRDRRRTTVWLGAGVAVGAVVLAVVYGVVRTLVVNHFNDPESHAAAGAVWDAFLSDLRIWAFLLAGAGAIVAASAGSRLRPIDLDTSLRRVSRWLVAEPASPVWRFGRGIALVAAGILVIVERGAVVSLLVTLAGAYLIYLGVNAVQRLIYRAPDVQERLPEPSAGPNRRRTILGGLLAAVLIIAPGAIFAGSGGLKASAPAPAGCEGYVALCDRSLAQIAIPATHNAMSVPLPGWYSAEQDFPIPQQLHDGVRGLLIDTHYADRLPNGRLRTDDATLAALRTQAAQESLSQESVNAALRIRSRLGFAGQGTRGMYLCHSFCELGGTPLASVLDDLHDFLVANPNQVVVVINQDYVKPKDFVDAVDEAGLGDMAYLGAYDKPMPTLRQMIATNQRVVFLAENHAGGAPWYRLAYQRALQETPFHFSKVSQLTDPDELAASCRPNRGTKGAPLFLFNHWITTAPLPRPSDADQVNAYKPLLARLRECEHLRDHIPNLVAVNFYKRGDVLRAIDTLNGV
jgi:hypothetical protein